MKTVIYICQLDERRQLIAKNYYMLTMQLNGEPFTSQDVEEFINNKIADVPSELQELLK